MSITGQCECDMIFSYYLGHTMPPVKGKMLNYPEEQMNLAIDAVLRGMPVATAAKRFSVPRITLMYKAKGKSPKTRRMGPDPVLTNEEEYILEDWILTMAKAGFPITKSELLDSVQHLIQELQRKNPFLDNRPGKTWYNAFLKRHPVIGIRMAQNLTSSRAAVKEETVKWWFKEVDEYLTLNNFKEILEHPHRVFNLDETAFFLNPKGNKVLARRGERNVYQQVNADEKDCLTVLVTGNANGEIAPPLIVFKYARIPLQLSESVPKHWGIGKSETGWMTGALFFEFISNVFHPFLLEKKIPLPVIVFIDGHASHLTLHTSKFCKEHGIILVALLPNSTHLIQPMDVAVFRVLKENWKKKVHQWRVSNLDQPVLKKIHFAPLLEETMAECITPSILQNGFRKTGLVPWNPEAVDYSKIPTASRPNDPAPSTSRHIIPKEIRVGLECLEMYIDKEKLESFRSSSDVWEGNVNDCSLFLVWKKMKEDSDKSMSSRSIGETELVNHIQQNHNIDTEEGIDIADQNQNNREEETDMRDQCATPKRITGIPHVNQNTLSGGNIREESDNKLIPSPFKRALFWPENTQKAGKRRPRENVPSVVTSKQWQEYHEKKKEAKLQKEKLKLERAEQRRLKKEQTEIAKRLKIKMKIENRKKPRSYRKRKISVSSDSEDDEEWIESGSSMDDVTLLPDDESHTSDEVEEENENTLATENKKRNEETGKMSYKKGDFVLVSFPGKKKVFKYVCIVQHVFEDGEIEVMAMKCCNRQKKVFQVDENDVSAISSSQIIATLPLPLSNVCGDHLKYEFQSAIDCDM